MKKVFLYLYPVQEYNRSFEISDKLLKQLGRGNPYNVMNVYKKDIEKKDIKLFMQFILIKIFMELTL